MMRRVKNSRPAQVLKAYGESKGGNYAAALALRAFLTMFPLILGILSIVGLLIHDPGIMDKVNGTIASIFPSSAHDEILQALQGAKRSAGLLGIVSIAGLLWSGTSLFSAMEFSLTQIFGTKQRDALRQRLMGLIMVLIFLAAVLVAVAVNSAAAASPLGVLSQLAGPVLGAVVMIALLTAIYRFVPNRTFPLRQIWPGAVLAGVLIELFSLVFPLYAKLTHGFNTYGQQFALFFLLATWLTFLSQFILLGAVFNKVRLGAPQDEGVVSSSDADSKEIKRPVDAVEDQQAGSSGDSAELTGRSLSPRPAPASSVPAPTSSGQAAEIHRPSSREAGIALGLGAVAAGIGAAVVRGRRR